MMKKIKQLIVLAGLFALILPTAILAESSPVITIFVFGAVTINGSPASSGTVSVEGVSASIGSDGKYSIELLSENVEKDYMVNGNKAAKTLVGSTDVWKKINLTVTTPITPTPALVCNPSSISNGIIGPYPQCAVTCNSGYSLSNEICAATSSGGGGTPSSSSSSAPVSVNTPALTPSVPTVPTSPTPQVLGVKISAAQAQVNKILGEAGLVSARNWGSIVREVAQEKNTEKKYLQALIKGLKAGELTDEQKSALIEFITYGTETTKVLGAGERAGTANSYKAAFGKLPKTEADWADAIKIANGRWPNQRSATAETGAKTSFKKIYGREANMENQNDNAAVTVMAYGLRPSQRNLNSEKAAILAFKYFLKRTPTTAVDWDIVRAIAYSGAKR